jgi:hypothetical protein
LVVAVCGEHHDLGARDLAQPGDDLGREHVRQPQIEQDQVGLQLGDPLNRGPPRLRTADHGQRRVGAQQERHAVADDRVVVDDHDPCGHPRRPTLGTHASACSRLLRHGPR